MQVEAIYRNGQLQFVTPLKIKQDSLRVMVIIPDEAVELNSIHRGIPSEVVKGAGEMLARMEAIRKAPMPPDEALPEMTDKQRERIEAMELRDEIREMR
jgi:hypothetical protein